MLSIPGYQVTEQLYESAHSMIYRRHHTVDHQPVVLKVLKGDRLKIPSFATVETKAMGLGITILLIN